MAKIYYPIGIQNFPDIRELEYVYVDKTMYIQRLLSEKTKFVFLSRPRRFGKSLFLSTLHEYFAGRKELFDGLAISCYEKNWVKHPVLHLDFTGVNYSEPNSLGEKLNNIFVRWELEYGIANHSDPLGVRFENIIRKAYEVTGQKVVILIDEYDKALLETVDNPELQEQFRNTLRGVYGNLKGMDRYIRFAMLTGVTKFGHLSIFSDLNNLKDISIDRKYAGICGITDDELHEYFDSGVADLAEARGWSQEKAYDELRRNYDGYHFSVEGSPDIYNPFSVINALQACRIGSYWFSTGTPTFLVKMIRSKQLPLEKLDSQKISVDDVMNISFDMKGSLVPLLYQTGYLTIRGYNQVTELLTLDFPNREVERGFLYYLMRLYIPQNVDTPASCIGEFYDDVCAARIDSFMNRLKSLFADFPYDSFNLVKLEQHYQDVTYIIFKLLGFLTHVEYRTASGRIDMVVKTPGYIYVFEFKLDKSAEEALAQIDTKEYMIPFATDGRKLVKIGANFDSVTRGLANWIAVV